MVQGFNPGALAAWPMSACKKAARDTPKDRFCANGAQGRATGFRL